VKLSTRTRYGLRALLDIAKHETDGPVRLREIAGRQGVSLSYLEHIVGPLIASGILKSTRGVGGGVSLVPRPQEILVADAVYALEGPLAATDCVRKPDVCPRSGSCSTRVLWAELTEAMNAVLGSRTLAGLLAGDAGPGASLCAPDAMRPLRAPLFGVTASDLRGVGGPA